MDNIHKLGSLLASAPSTIELIPGNGQEWLESFPGDVHAPFLFIEGNLGIPESILYQVYMAAIQILGEPKSYFQRLQTDADRENALALTSTVLLANPAHQTALNIRKAIVLNSESDAMLNQACTTELEFVAALLSVKQCSKVSMLWHHRRALLTRIHTEADSDSVLEHDEHLRKPRYLFADEDFDKVGIPLSALQIEFDLATRACEVYPRNYYAWYHRSLCLRSCLAALLLLTTRARKPVDVESRLASADLEEILKNELAHARRWIERHVSDHSAIDHACRVAEALDALPPSPAPNLDPDPDSGNAQLQLRVLRTRYTEDCALHALELVQSYPSHEALWLYVRRTVLMLMTEDSDPESAARLTEEADAIARSILGTASQRCQADSKSDAVNCESHSIIRHALRFLLWRNRTRIDSEAGLDFLALACIHFSAASSTKNDIALLRTISSIE